MVIAQKFIFFSCESFHSFFLILYYFLIYTIMNVPWNFNLKSILFLYYKYNNIHNTTIFIKQFFNLLIIKIYSSLLIIDHIKKNVIRNKLAKFSLLTIFKYFHFELAIKHLRKQTSRKSKFENQREINI